MNGTQSSVADTSMMLLMEKLVAVTKLANHDAIKERLLMILDSADKKRVFEATDGISSARDIAARTGIGFSTVTRWWSDWNSQGIVEESENVQGRRRRLVSLREFGIEVPPGKKQQINEPKIKQGRS